MRRPGLILVALAATACAPPPRRAPNAAEPPPPSPLAAVALAEDARNVEALRSCATETEPEVRRRAARALGRCGAKEAISPLVELAADRDPAVAAEALFALGLVDIDAALARLPPFANPPPDVRVAFVRALGRSAQDSTALRIAPFLKDREASVRGAAALSLARLAGGRFAGTRSLGTSEIDAIAAALSRAAADERDAGARWREVYALSEIGGDAPTEALLRAAHDPEETVRLFAARGLGKRKSANDAALVELARDGGARVACEAALALEKHPSEQGCKELAALLDRPEFFVRRAAVRAMGGARGFASRVAPALERASADPSPSVRAETSIAAARLTAAAALPLIEERLSDPHPLVRAKAAEAAAVLAPNDALPLLERALGDPHRSVGAAAAAALAKVDGPSDAPLPWRDRARELARRALRHADGLVVENAAESLVALDKPLAAVPNEDLAAIIEALFRARGEDLAEVRSVLIESAEALTPRLVGDASLLDRLHAALLDASSDPDPSARAKARRAWEALFTADKLPKVGLPAPPTPAIPGANAPPFLRAPRIRIVTNRGSFEARFFTDETPVHAENFLELAELGRYEGTPFHRVELNFVVQGGDHRGDGTGSRAAAGGCIRDELSTRPFLRGTIGMPKTDVPDSGGSQIFVCQIPAPHLDGRYTAFGVVTRGMNVIDALEVGDVIERVEVIDRGR